MTGMDPSNASATSDAHSDEVKLGAPGASAPPARGRREALILAGVVLVLSVIAGFRLSAYGVWDPWELSVADDARRLLDHESLEPGRPLLSTWLVARAFAIFGVHEWSGRLPITLASLLLLALAAGVGRLYGDLRRGAYVAIVLGTTPLFLLNARHMMGFGPGFLASALVFVFASLLAFPVASARSPRARGGLAIGLLGSALFAAETSGVLLGVAPPLAAVASAVVARLPWDGRPLSLPTEGSARLDAWAGLGVVALTLAVVVGTALAILGNQEGYSIWTGGVPRGQTPPSFEMPIQALFHAFAPWSAVLPIAAGFVMTYGSARSTAQGGGERADTARAIDLAAFAWVGLAFAAQSVQSARYGDGAFLAPFAVAWLVASYLRATEERSHGETWARGIVVALLVGLLVRDFHAYPGSPIEGLSLRSFTMPEVFNPTAGWAITLGLFGLTAFFAFASDPTGSPRTLMDEVGARSWRGLLVRLFVPVHLLDVQWHRSRGHRVWLVLGALATSVLVGFGLAALTLSLAARGADDEDMMLLARVLSGRISIGAGVVAGALLVLALLIRFVPSMSALRARARRPVAVLGVVALGLFIGAGILSGIGWNSLAIRVGIALFALPFAVLLVLGVARVVYHALTTLRANSLVPMVATSVVLAAWFVGSFHLQASAHFSPREIYDTYNALHGADEPLGEYQVGGRAAALYAHGEVLELRSEAEVLELLARPSRVWLALPTEQLAQLDRTYRQRAGRHLFVADARNARAVLATNQPIEGRADENFLAGFVLDAPPTIQHPVNASFDRRIELLGYDLELPNGDSVGPGQQFTVTWYWRCVVPVPGGYQPFLHIDGYGQRLNGDHEPVDGRYPVRMWSEGDVVVDRQELRVPANYPPGDYTFFIGLYSGESRLEVVEGQKDDANRVIAGRLRVR